MSALPKNPDRIPHYILPLLLGLALIGLVLLASALQLPAMLGRVETSLLDLRLRARADTLHASEDIVIVAMDRRTLDYGRNHPEFGIRGKVMPRDKLARVIDALPGAGSILLDLYFDEPQGEAQDRALVEAIRRAGNVYVGAYVELPLDEYRTQRGGDPQRLRQDSLKALNKYRLLPWMADEARRQRLAGGVCNLDAAGFGPFRDVPALVGMERAVLAAYWQAQCRAPRHSSAAPQAPSAPISEAGFNTERLYREECLEGKYEEQYRRHPGFLAQLERLSVPLIAPEGEVRAYCMMSPVLEPVLEAARGLGIISVQYDKDAVIRQVPPMYRAYRGNAYPYLGMRPLLERLAQSPQVMDGRLRLDDKVIPLPDEGQMLLNWRSPLNLAADIHERLGYSLSDAQRRAISPELANPELGYGHLYRIVSALDLLRHAENPDLPASETPSLYNLYGRPESGLLDFRGKTVIYGDILEDIHRTPVGDRIYGPEILATAVDMLQNDRLFLQKAPGWAVLLSVLLFGLLTVYWQVSSPRLLVGTVLGLCMLVLYWVANFLVFIHAAWWAPLVGPTAFLSVALMGGIVYRYYVQDREKRHLTRAFSKYVSPQVMHEILVAPEKSLDNLAGKKKELTVLFADLRGFTNQFEAEDPERMVAQLNEFFTAMTAIILKHQGTHDKYMGDAIMAFFGAPVDMADHAEKACRAALEMQEKLRALNADWTARGYSALGLGIGLSTGMMLVGNVGSDELKNFTVMGSWVNLGARIETLTRKVDAGIIISENTFLGLPEGLAVTRDLGMVRFKGFTTDHQVYALEELNAAADA